MDADIRKKAVFNRMLDCLVSKELINRMSIQKDIASALGIKPTNVSYAYKGDKRYLTDKFLERVNAAFGDIFNPGWLLTGEGAMLKGEADAPPEGGGEAGPPAATVLLLPVSSRGGTLNDFVASVKQGDCERVVSPIRGVDFAMAVSGDSMAPEYPNGCRVFIKRIDERAFIEWGKVYVLDTCNGTVIKKVMPGKDEGCVTCVSINPEYPPFTVSFADMYGMYRVLMMMAEK